MPLDVTSRMADVLVSPAAPQLVHDPGAPRASAPHFDDTPQRHAHQAARVAVARAQAAHGERERLLRAARAALELARTLPPPGPAISSGAAAAPPRGATVHEHGPGPPAALVNHACSSSRSVTAVSLQQVAEPTHAATEPTQMSLVQQHLDHLAVHTARLAVPLRHAHGIEPSSLYAVADVSHGADGASSEFPSPVPFYTAPNLTRCADTGDGHVAVDDAGGAVFPSLSAAPRGIRVNTGRGKSRPLFANATARASPDVRHAASNASMKRSPSDGRWRPSCCCSSCAAMVSPSQMPPVQRAELAVGEIRAALDDLVNRGTVSLPDVASAICSATLRATAPHKYHPDKRSMADVPSSVFASSPYAPCPPGHWAVGRLPGDPHEAPLCTCGVRGCQAHFAVIDVVELYDMHCKHVCSSHRRNAAGFVDESAHSSCYIHTLLTLLSGVWVPWRDTDAEPQTQQRASRIATPPSTPEGQFVTAQLAKGIELDLWERLSDDQVNDVSQCTIIEAGFAALVGKLILSEREASVVNDSAPSIDVPAVNAAAEARAGEFIAKLRSQMQGAPVTKAVFAQTWTAQGGGDKMRFCVAHDKHLNPRSCSWQLVFPTAQAILETSQPDDIFITRDHKSGYSVVPIRADQRRFFCFFDPVTGDVYRCKRLDFGWQLSPGIFCAFTAELNAIITSRLTSEADARALSHYYVDDCIVRVPPKGAPTYVTPVGEATRQCSATEATAIAILEEVSRLANFPTSPDKVRWGSAVVYLGLLINSASRTAVVMPSKLFKALTMMHVVRAAILDSRINVPVSFVLKMAGNMQWLAQNFRSGRLHTPSLWLAAERLRSRRARTVMECENLLETCEWWAAAAAGNRLRPHNFICSVDIPSISVSFDPTAIATGASAANGVPMPILRPTAHRPAVAVLTDAAGEEEGGAMGAIWRGVSDVVTHAFHAAFTPEQRAWRAICSKELLAIVTWLERFGRCYKGSVILFGTDNCSNVFTVNRLRTDVENKVMSELLSRLLAVADENALECLVWWCPRGLNGIADALSKCPTLADARRIAHDLGIVLH